MFIEELFYSHHATGVAYDNEKRRASAKRTLANQHFNVLKEFFTEDVLASPDSLRQQMEKARVANKRRDETESLLNQLVQRRIRISFEP